MFKGHKVQVYKIQELKSPLLQGVGVRVGWSSVAALTLVGTMVLHPKKQKIHKTVLGEEVLLLWKWSERGPNKCDLDKINPLTVHSVSKVITTK